MNSLSSRRGDARALTVAAAFVLVALACSRADAQCPAQTFTGSLEGPSKMIQTPLGNLIVAETGTVVPNTGRVSVVDRAGNRRTLLDGLPSGFNEIGDLSGATAVALVGRTLYVTNGEGDGTIAGPVPGTELPNPHPSSPIMSSVLALRFSANAERTTTGFALTHADHQALKSGATLTLTDTAGNRATVWLVADFPDATPDPLPFFPANVRHSNSYGLVAADNTLYVVDAGANSVRRVDATTGASSTLTTFAPIPNPAPFGGPFIEAVPAGVALDDGRLLVALFRGFPFLPGTGEIRAVDPATGQQSTFIAGLTSAIDVLPARDSDGETSYLTLELSTNLLANAPGRLSRFDAGGANPAVVSACLISPGSMVFDAKSGRLYVAEVFTGRVVVVRVAAPRGKAGKVYGLISPKSALPRF